jgi:hypothetical protein
MIGTATRPLTLIDPPDLPRTCLSDGGGAIRWQDVGDEPLLNLDRPPAGKRP